MNDLAAQVRRRARRGRHPGEQRRHRDGRPVPGDDVGALGRHHGRQCPRRHRRQQGVRRADGRARRGRNDHQYRVGGGIHAVEIDGRLQHDQGGGAGIQRILACRPRRRGHHRDGRVPGIRQHQHRQKHCLRRDVDRTAGSVPGRRRTRPTGGATSPRKPPPRRSSRPSGPARPCCRSPRSPGSAMRCAASARRRFGCSPASTFGRSRNLTCAGKHLDEQARRPLRPSRPRSLRHRAVGCAHVVRRTSPRPRGGNRRGWRRCAGRSPRWSPNAELVAPDVVALTLADPDGGIAAVLDPRWTHRRPACPRAGAGSTRCAVRRGGAPTTVSPSAGSPTVAAVRSRCTTLIDVGDTLVFEGPRNAFYLGTTERDVLFVIGGIGVTAHFADDPGRPATRNRLARSLCRSQPRVHAVPGRGGVGGAGPGHRVGRRRARSRSPPSTTCWPAPGRRRPSTCAGRARMLEAVRVARDEHADAPLHYERFSPPPVVDGIPFELELARSQRVLSVPANRSALDVMLDRDPTTAVLMPAGLLRDLQGQSACRTGRSPWPHRVVGDDEMLVCVSRSKSRPGVVDADV